MAIKRRPDDKWCAKLDTHGLELRSLCETVTSVMLPRKEDAVGIGMRFRSPAMQLRGAHTVDSVLSKGY